MYRKLIKTGFILAMLLISIVSLSMAACPTAVSDLYGGTCGEVLSVPAPGLLGNDIKDAGKTLQVVNPDSITISIRPWNHQSKSRWILCLHGR